MQPLLQPLFLISLTAFLVNQGLELLGCSIWPLHLYLDDLLCLPITLSIVLAAEQAYFRNSAFTLPWQYTLASIGLFSFVFEAVLPLLSAKYTADPLDVLFYSIGGVIFHFGINKPIKIKAIKRF